MLHISIKAEPLFHVFGFPVTNSYLTSLIVLVLLLLISKYYSDESQRTEKSNAFYVMNTFITGMYNLFKSVVGERIGVFFPLLGGLFFYILFQNWFGLLPGVGSLLVRVQEQGQTAFIPLFRGASADLNTTLALGLIAFVCIQYFGIKYVGAAGYFKKFIDMKNPLSFFIGPLEIVSELSRIISFSFRLFGNIFAGEVLMAVIAFLIPVLVSFPFLVMEIFVGFIQALVFSMLTAVFLQMATAKHSLKEVN